MVEQSPSGGSAAAQGATAQIIAFPERRHEGETWEPWLDEKAIARHYCASTRTVRRWMHAGMPSRLIGGLRRYRLSQCEDWHERRRSA